MEQRNGSTGGRSRRGAERAAGAIRQSEMSGIVRRLAVWLFAGGIGCLWGAGSPPDLDADAEPAGEPEVATPAGDEACPAGVVPRVVFGPERFERSTGRPERESRSLTVDDPSGIFSLVILNGNPAGRSAGERERIASAVVQLNGRTVVGPERFSMDVARICVRLDGIVAGGNELSVELRSRPGSFIILRVVRTLVPVPVESLDLTSVPAATCVARPVGAAIAPSGVVVPLDPAALIESGVVLVRFSDEVVVRPGTVSANLTALGVTSIESVDSTRGVFLGGWAEVSEHQVQRWVAGAVDAGPFAVTWGRGRLVVSWRQ
ncbi:MAG: hypothetical protein HY905_11700 [Deltaproteobacteria bacterium]|nr:hypothetical protein [Deltaproteobacteria bacterium]